MTELKVGINLEGQNNVHKSVFLLIKKWLNENKL